MIFRFDNKMKIDVASTDRVNQYPEIVEDFMLRVFGIDWYLITDLSTLRDFVGITDQLSRIEAVRDKILKEYGFYPQSNVLADIFEEIHGRSTAPD